MSDLAFAWFFGLFVYSFFLALIPSLIGGLLGYYQAINKTPNRDRPSLLPALAVASVGGALLSATAGFAISTLDGFRSSIGIDILPLLAPFFGIMVAIWMVKARTIRTDAAQP